VGALLGLASALCYGAADVAGGLLSRRAGFAAIALTGQVGGLVLTLALAPAIPASGVAPRDIAWGALSGAGTGLGMMYLYRGLSRGDMSVVVPVSAVGSVALPVLAGVVLLGDRPTALTWLGVVTAVPALWFVSRGHGRTGPAGVAACDGLIASAGIALQYIALARVDAGSGIWPVAVGRLAAVVTILVLARPSRCALRLSAPVALAAGANGGIAALALVFYLLATREQLVVVAVVLSSLYPVVPVLLGVTALRERLSWRQAAGLAGAAAAIGLLIRA
jgi:drug/metabolite transporter (DMT)-like permease